MLELFSATGLRQIRDAIQLTSAKQSGRVSKVVQGFLDRFDLYESTIDRVIAFLQGRDATLVHRIAGRTYLPEGERFRSLDVFVGDDEGDDPMAWAFGALGVQDRAKHLATLYLSDLADVLKDAIDPRFEFVRYAESLAASQPTFDPLAEALSAPRNLVDETLHRLTIAALTNIARRWCSSRFRFQEPSMQHSELLKRFVSLP